MIKLNYYSVAHVVSANLCFCSKPLFASALRWNGMEQNGMSIYLGNRWGISVFLSTCRSLFEREGPKMLISLIALSCKLGSFMSHRITDTLGMAEAGSHLWGTSSQNRSARTGCPGLCPGRFGSFPMMDIPQTI